MINLLRISINVIFSNEVFMSAPGPQGNEPINLNPAAVVNRFANYEAFSQYMGNRIISGAVVDQEEFYRQTPLIVQLFRLRREQQEAYAAQAQPAHENNNHPQP
jgi:hypothetical protein